MKKNTMMRLASFLLVAVLMSSSVISGTFAKYVTSGEATDQARVAKWGVTITAEGTAFAETYATDDGEVKGTIANSVVSIGANDDALTDKVVAPGTKGDMVMIKLSGSPEVAVNVSYEAHFSVGNWVVDGKFYCPLEITVGKNVVKGLEFNNAEDFMAKVNGLISAYSKTYNANTDLSTVAAPKVSWAWPFSTGVNNDAKDTALGNQAADMPGKITLSIVAIVTQID